MLGSQDSVSDFGANIGSDTSAFAVNQLPDIFGVVKAKLQQAATNAEIFTDAFGNKANTVELQTVIKQWSVGDFRNLPSVQILSAANANEALGAYASSTQTVYLSDVLFQANAARTNSSLGAAGVLVEETFHWLDDRVGADTAGDEGELARNLLFGDPLSDSELNRITNEDDTGLITINGQQTSAELNIDYAGNTSTTGFVPIGGSVSGTINFAGDTDWFRVNLVAGTTYQFRQNRTTLGDPFLTLRNNVGGFIASNDDGGGNYNSLITYRATSTGTHFLDARGIGSSVGTYTVTANALALDDYAGNTSTTGFVSVGGSATGRIEVAGDTDWFRVNLVAGTTYQFRQNRTTLGDPFLTLRNNVGGFITYRATSTGTHFLDARGIGSSVGTYTVTANVAATPPSGFSSVYGYGLINAAAAVARAIGQSTPFADVPNLGGNNWGNDLVNAPEAWARGYTGQGITVAVIDSGVDINHPDLLGRIWRNTGEIAGNGIDDDGNGYVDDVNGWNFGLNQNNNNILPGTTSLGQGHGTHVAGTIVGRNNGVGITGVAYGASVMPIRLGNVNDRGSFTNPGNLASAIRYAVNNGARVINMSIVWSDSSELRDAMAYAASRNVITVSSAGNSSSLSPGTPAHYATQYGLSVGAIDINRNIASFSNRAGSNNAMQHVVAPGVNIYSTTPGNTYGFQNGTSMAAPHVAGVVALMLSANRALTHAQVRSIVTSSASRLSQSSTGSLGVNTVTGSNIPQGIGISVSSNLPDSNSLNNFASLDYQTVTSVANPSTTNLTTPSQNVGLIQTTVSNVVSTESTRKPVSTPKPLNVARNVFDLKILDSSLVNQSDWVLGTI
jgi:subtilisin family serine protease